MALERRPSVVGALYEREAGANCRSQCGGWSGGEYIGSCPVLEQLGARWIGRYECAGYAEGLAQGTDEEIWADPGCGAGSAALRPHNTEAVSFVYDEGGVKFICQKAQLCEVCEVSLHGEEGVGDDETSMVRLLVTPEERAQRVEVSVGKYAHSSARQPTPIDDARVVQFVGVDEITLTSERGENPDVGCVAARKERGVWTIHKSSELRLTGSMFFMTTSDQARGSGADSESTGGFTECAHHSRIVGEAEVVVG